MVSITSGIVHFYFPLFVHLNSIIYINLYPNSENRPKRVENPTAADRKSLPKQRKPAEKVEIPSAAGRKSLPKQRKSAEKVENPTAAGWKSLPKRRESAEKGRDSQFRRPTLPSHTALPKQLKIAQSKFSCS